MKLFNTTSKNFIFLLAPVSFFLLASCGSYQYSGYEDGIYGETNRDYERQNQNATQDGNSSYYKNLFAEEAALSGEVLSESTIFTDVDSYSSTGDYDPTSNESYNYQGGHAPWGNVPDSYSINIYNTGFHGGYYGPYWGNVYGYDPFWGPGYYGPAWYRPGFYSPYGPRYWGSSWSIGFGGFNYGHWGYGNYGYAYRPYAYGGWSNNYYYGNRYPISRRNVAYNAGRREAVSSYSRNTSVVRNATILENRSRNSSYSRSIRSIRGSNDDYGLTRRAVSRTYDPRRSSEYNRSNTVNRRSSSDTYSRSQAPTRHQSSGTMRRSNTTQSSGTVRSSGSTTRSSEGTTTRGRGRGRGN